MSKKSTRQAYGEALVELGRINNDIVVLDADLSKSTKTDLFKKEFPKRHLNIGIAEVYTLTFPREAFFDAVALCGSAPR